MFITKKHLDRRTMLRGMGAAVGLPLLEAMIPARTALAATAAAPKQHLGFIYFPHGAVASRWIPKKDGHDFDFPNIIAPLEPFKKYTSIVSGTENGPAISSAVHAIMPGTWLSCVHPRETGADLHAGVTIDQIAAQHIGQDTPFPSIEVATEARNTGGSCDRAFGCSYSATISFRTPTTPLPMETNPRTLFQRLFGAGENAVERKALAKQYASVVDVVRNEATELKRNISVKDRAMLDDYLDSVREIERRIQKMEARDLSSLDLPESPNGVPERFDEHLNMMFDMTALAWQANMTRIFSMMMVGEGTNLTYNHIGISDAFHPLSHHQNDETKMERLSRVQEYHTKVFAKFLDKLSKMPDGDGTMLDHSMILFGSNMGNSNAHNNFPLPSALVGGGCGKLKGNMHLRVPDKTPHANLLLTMLERAGVPETAVGDSQTTFSEL